MEKTGVGSHWRVATLCLVYPERLPMTYPTNWNDLRKAVRVRDEECMNCRRSPANTKELPFDVNHVVPLRWGGSNRMSNLIYLCRDCHDAIHGRRRMAPIVKFHSNGSMEPDEFELWREFWDVHDLARFDPFEECWYIPVADVKYFTEGGNRNTLGRRIAS